MTLTKSLQQHPAGLGLLPGHVHPHSLAVRRQRGAAGLSPRLSRLLRARLPAARHCRRDGAHHRLQLHSLRHHGAYGRQLPGLYVLDRPVVPRHALDPRRHQLVQLAALRHPLSLRHLRLLRRLHLPPEGRPGPHPAGRPRALLPERHGLHAGLLHRLCLRPARRQLAISPPRQGLPQGLRHPADRHLFHRLRAHRQDEAGVPREPAHERRLLPHPGQGLARPLLGHQGGRRVPGYPVCGVTDHPVLV